MSDKFIPNRGTEDKINQLDIASGSLNVTTDGNLYVDFPTAHGGRVKITDIVINDNKSTLTKPGKLYINKNSHDMWIYDADSKKEYRVGASGQSVYKTTYNLSTNANITTSSISDVVNGILDQGGTNVVTGALLIDDFENIAVITSISGTTIKYKVLIDSSKSNIITENAYIDANYGGKEEVGTFEKPFKSWRNFYTEYNNANNHYIDMNNVAVHLLSDIIINTDISNISNLSIIGEKSKNTKVTIEGNLSNISSCEFKNINFTNSITLNDKTAVIYIDECDLNNIILDNCDMIYITNCNIANSININDSSSVHVSNCNPDHVPSIIITGDNANHNDDNYTFDINISNMYCRSISVDLTNYTLDKLNISNVIISDSLNIKDTDVINLYSGSFTGTASNIELNATNINLGTFSFNNLDINNANSKIKGTITANVGLTSKQVYDKKTRKYGNKEFTLEKHLDAIDEYTTNTNTNLTNLKEKVDTIINAHVSENTIINIDDLSSYNLKEGRVLKYVGLNTAELITTYKPTVKSGKEITQKNENGVDEKYIEVEFSLENASYHCTPYKDEVIINEAGLDVTIAELEINEYQLLAYSNQLIFNSVNLYHTNTGYYIFVFNCDILNKLTDSYHKNVHFDNISTSTSMGSNDISSAFGVNSNGDYITGSELAEKLSQLSSTHCLHYNGAQWEMIDRSTLSGPAELLITSITKGDSLETDTFKATIKSSLVASDFLTNLNKYTATYNHKMNLFTNDRIVKLSNGWDKLNDIAPTNTLEAINVDLNTLGENAIYYCLKTDSVSYNYPGSETKGVLYNFSVNNGITQLFIAATDSNWGDRYTIYSRFVNTVSATPTASVWTTYLIDADNSVWSNHIRSAAILSRHISNNAISSNHIVDGTITGTDIAANTITSNNIKDGAIVNADIGNNQIAKEKLDANLQTTITNVENLLKNPTSIAIENTTLTGNEPKGTIQFVVESSNNVVMNVKYEAEDYATLTFNEGVSKESSYYNLTYIPTSNAVLTYKNGDKAIVRYNSSKFIIDAYSYKFHVILNTDNGPYLYIKGDMFNVNENEIILYTIKSDTLTYEQKLMSFEYYA